ncbi:MAG: hypothetical protein AAF682_20365 [Planctomycetota bacterium]
MTGGGKGGWGELLGLNVELEDFDSGASLQRPRPGLTPQRVLLAMRNHWMLAVGVAFVISLTGAFAVHRKFRPLYRSEAILFVRPTAPSLAYTGEEWRAESIVGFYGDYVRTLKSIATEHELLSDVVVEIESAGVRWRSEHVTLGEAPAHLRARLDVRHVRDSYLLSIGFDDRDPSITAPVVNAVARALIAAQAREQRADAEGRLGTLEQERERLRSMLDSNQTQIEELSAAAGLAVLDERQNVFYERLIRLQDGVTKVYLERVQAEAALEVELARAEALRGPVPEGHVLRLLDEDTTVRDARLMFERLVREVNDETGDLAEVHPARAQGLARVKAAAASLDQLERNTLARLAHRIELESTEEADRLEREARTRVEAALRGEEQMAGVVEEAEAELEAYARSVQLGMALRSESQRLLDAIERVDGRMEELVVESKAPGRLSLRSEGVEAGKPTGDRRKLMLAMVAVFSLAVAIGAALAAEAVRAWMLRRRAADKAALVTE